ncbi:TPA: aminopeptidase [candidate division WOR-3 bacterium]|jgi:endoglucanase|uniref:Aminopeptidase n=1 Tax=candidate division WOR-3 bacterium TaxID=2052148 RepID=A0A350H9C5_UNCW3|nr:aminopeptidase [candidate division WOR-3 bacterium]
MNTLLKRLTEIHGVSGCEDSVREIIIEEIKPFCDSLKIDKMGNVIALKKGTGNNRKKIMLGAHMDEVGFMIKSIDENGSMKFMTAGSIDRRVLIGKRVLVGKERIPGAIIYKAVHNQRGEYEILPKIEQLCIDIGCNEKKETEKFVSVGDYAVFATEYEERGDIMKGKAFDDRFGCYAIIETFKSKYINDVYGAFFVQEEVGLRGSIVSTFSIEPDYAIVLEGTSAADMPHEKDEADFPKMQEGVVVTISDRTFFANKEFLSFVESVAKKNKIKYQFKQPMVGGTDAGMIHTAKCGIKTMVFAVPSRYIHSPVCYASMKDLLSMIELTKKTINNIK